MDDTNPNGPETGPKGPQAGPVTPATDASPAPTPSPEAADDVLQDEIESIHAIGEDQ